MKYFGCIFLFVFLVSWSAYSQENYTRHRVTKGETISEIAEKYNISTKAIYQLNPKAKKGIKYNTVLLIPAKSKQHLSPKPDDAVNSTQIKHEVLPKETLYGIAKQYNISIEDLYKINPELEKEGLKKGQIIKIPQADSEKLVSDTKPEKANVAEKNISKEEVILPVKSDNKADVATEGIVREVLPKETLYSIAKQYGITVANLKNANPSIGAKALKAGQKIIVPVNAENNPNSVVKNEVLNSESSVNNDLQTKQKENLSQEVTDNNSVSAEIIHKVLPKETKYGIAKQYGITVAELEEQNPKIVKRLSAGSLLKIKSSELVENVIPEQQVVATEKVVNEESNENSSMVRDADFVDQLIMKASENIGTRYRSGGTTKDGFDCSGLVYSTFGTFDIKLPRSSIEMASYGTKINTENAQKGDLIFFRTNGRRHINHVGMVVEVCDGEIKFIHSSNHGGVIISSTKESYYGRNLVQVNRVL